MSKFKKVPEKVPKKKKSRSDEEFAYRTVIISTIFSSIFLILSMLFNGGIITIFNQQSLLWDTLDVLIKGGVILLFYFFTMISYGNYKELNGKPIEFKELLLLFLLALVQSSLHPYVFGFTLFGLFLLIGYFYLIQES